MRVSRVSVPEFFRPENVVSVPVYRVDGVGVLYMYLVLRGFQGLGMRLTGVDSGN
jgi:hypothetical protein